jgi:alkylhydroperoxidase/carboxymuconolactone decarboxylase family protein YurZ
VVDKEEQTKLRDEYVRTCGGTWDESLEPLLGSVPKFFEAYTRLAAVPWKSSALEPKVKELVALAIDAATTHLYVDGIRAHIHGAMSFGASADEITETLEVASVLGVHSLTVGVPLLLELVQAHGSKIPGENEPLTADQEVLKAAFVEKRGYWTPLWEQVLKLSPAYFEAYLDFSALPWAQGYLEPKTKEFIYIAITASTTHLFEPGIRVHVANALGYGATVHELLEILEIASLVGVQTLSVALPVLESELGNS